jgi:S-DNA-T family DNA segregation ATPase FtsK/SpoIIIE
LAKPQVAKDRFGRESVQPPLPLTEPTPSRPLPALPPEPGPAARETLPPRRLFDPPGQHAKADLAALEIIKDVIGQKLSEFKIKGAVTGMQPGPVVTVFEFQPDPGIPLSRILGMEEDLALALQAEAVRMDRIPGKNLVGIEVPNPRREIITFREVIDSPAFRDAPGLLQLALGKDIAGKPVVADLNKMPHLLIGGSTGSGKSVGVNAMICSCLVRALPDEVKLILVDPKMVELGVYEDIPHLWAPVVTDMKEAGRVLKWVVAQMEDRYRRLALLSVRDLKGFNTKVADAGGSLDISERTPNPRWPDRPAVLELMPHVVVVIDELADLMMVARSEVEDSIARIAQKARAVGIHLILATQRPSVDVVTGVIKANLPSRLSYRVRTKIDSRTILDSGGGEQLLGAGDALFLPNGASHPKRIHAPFLTEVETLRLVTWLRERGRPDYNQALISAMETEEETALFDEAELGGGDDIYVRALAVVRRERKASTSLLQRKLNLGYGRAARLIDRMEEEGIVGPDRGAGKPREVLVEAE